MRFIWDRGLRTKLLGGFSVVIVFTIAVAAVGIRTQQAAAERTDVMYREDVRGTRSLLTANLNMVMSAATLREFVAARELAAKRYAEAEDVIRTDGLQIVAHQERIATLEATNERLRKRASEHLDAAGLRTLYDALEDDNMHTEAAMVQRLANGAAAHSRWFAIPERQRLDRIGQLVDHLDDVRHELEDDDIEAAEALINLAKGGA